MKPPYDPKIVLPPNLDALDTDENNIPQNVPHSESYLPKSLDEAWESMMSDKHLRECGIEASFLKTIFLAGAGFVLAHQDILDAQVRINVNFTAELAQLSDSNKTEGDDGRTIANH